MTSVSVVTLTHNRIGDLRLAMESVRTQSGVDTQHIVVADRYPSAEVTALAEWMRSDFPGSVLLDNQSVHSDYLPSHIAHLRYWASARIDGDYVAWLDDDNVFEPDHSAALVDSLRNDDTAIAHSWRTLWSRDGHPWRMGNRDPWILDPKLSERSFEILVAEGVYETGSNIVKDTLRLEQSGRIGRIDTNEWFFSKEAYEEFGKPVAPTAAQKDLGLTEDVLLTVKLARDRVPVSASHTPSVRYVMGGYSNENDAQTPLLLT